MPILGLNRKMNAELVAEEDPNFIADRIVTTYMNKQAEMYDEPQFDEAIPTDPQAEYLFEQLASAIIGQMRQIIYAGVQPKFSDSSVANLLSLYANLTSAYSVYILPIVNKNTIFKRQVFKRLDEIASVADLLASRTTDQELKHTFESIRTNTLNRQLKPVQGNLPSAVNIYARPAQEGVLGGPPQPPNLDYGVPFPEQGVPPSFPAQGQAEQQAQGLEIFPDGVDLLRRMRNRLEESINNLSKEDQVSAKALMQEPKIAKTLRDALIREATQGPVANDSVLTTAKNKFLKSANVNDRAMRLARIIGDPSIDEELIKFVLLGLPSELFERLGLRNRAIRELGMEIGRSRRRRGPVEEVDSEEKVEVPSTVVADEEKEQIGNRINAIYNNLSEEQKVEFERTVFERFGVKDPSTFNLEELRIVQDTIRDIVFSPLGFRPQQRGSGKKKKRMTAKQLKKVLSGLK